MPLDVVPELEGQGLVVAAPGPALREFRDDGIDAVLGDMLIEEDEVAVNRHEGELGQPAKPARGLAIRTSSASDISHRGIDCAWQPELAAFCRYAATYLRSVSAKNAAASLAKPSDVSDSLSPIANLSSDFAGSSFDGLVGGENARGVHDRACDHVHFERVAVLASFSRSRSPALA